MDYKLFDFIPLYNQAQTFEFNKDVNNLKEFTDFKLPREEAFPQHPGDLMLHQRLISNFINPRTPYDGLLLVHEMGTGKTCTAVGVAEAFIKNRQDVDDRNQPQSSFPSTILKKIVVLTKGKGLQANFVNEIANVCTRGQYLVGLDDYKKNKDRKLKKNIKVNYTFETFEVFSKSLKKISPVEKALLYENSLFIVDEAHNLRMSQDPEEGNIYREISGLFDLLKHKKILLLTGTPMKDQPEEIIDLLNLILKEKLTIEDLNNEASFKKKIDGYISYLRAMMSDVDRVEEGSMLGTLSHYKIYPVVMDSFQANVYLSARQRDLEERSIFNHSRQASMMVFPDKTYGKIGFEKNVFQTSSGFRFTRPEVKDRLKTQLDRYSAKYADLIRKLDDDFNNQRLSFVFSEFVKGSGLVVLSLLLEMNGYVKATSSSNYSKKKKRYAIFTNEMSTDSQTRHLISVFNHSRNKRGNNIATIIGSRVIMEGFSFKNIQSEYILTPHWNYSETSQIIARGFRLGSHNDLIEDGIIPEVKIYHYAALPSRQNFDDSIDLHMYEISEKKDFEIQKIMRTLKEVAFDCQLNKERNTITNANLNNTRSCEYTKCDYKCDNSSILGTDERNFKLLYFRLSEDYIRLKKLIIERVINFPVTIEEIVVETKRDRFEVMCVVEDLLNCQNNLFIRPEGSFYLSHSKDILYASNNPYKNQQLDDDDPQLLNYYIRNLPIFKGKSIDELIFDHESSFMVKLIDKVFESKNLVQLQTFVVQLPIYLQQKLLCSAIITMNKNTPNNFVRDMVLNNYKLYYYVESEKAFVWLDPNQYLCSSNNGQFYPCSSSEKNQIEKEKLERTKVKIKDNPYGYIGLLNRNSNDFCLKKIYDENDQVDKRKKNVGKKCINWKKKELVDLVSNRLKIRPDEDFNFDESDVSMMKTNPKFQNLLNINNGTLKDYKRVAFWNAQDMNYMCSKIMQKLMDQKLVVDDLNCGTSKKVR